MLAKHYSQHPTTQTLGVVPVARGKTATFPSTFIQPTLRGKEDYKRLFSQRSRQKRSVDSAKTIQGTMMSPERLLWTHLSPQR